METRCEMGRDWRSASPFVHGPCQFSQCLLSIADEDIYRVHIDIYEDPWRARVVK